MQIKKQQLESDMEQWIGSKLGRVYIKAVYRHPNYLMYLFNVLWYAEYIMWNAGLDESQAEIKTAWKNINHLIYADDTTLMTESKEELKILLMRVKEAVKQLAWNSTLKT